ncbi:MAG: hypothetical protein Fur005_25250 [Roseiflexaceae bacterium]
MLDRHELAHQIDLQRKSVAEWVAALLLNTPFWEARYGSGIRERLIIDTDQNIETLAKAVRYRSPMIFEDHMRWRRDLVIDRGCSSGRIREALAHTWDALSNLLEPTANIIVGQYIQSALTALSYPVASAQQVASQQEALADELICHTFDTDWHWQATYHNRAAAQAEAWFLIDMLIDSLGQQRTEPFSKYVHWLRGQYLKQGLSSAHMQQQLWLLGHTIEQRFDPDLATKPQRIIEAAANALVPESEACRALQASQEQIVGDVANLLLPRGYPAAPEQLAMEVGWMLAYLSDSLSQNDPNQFVGYTRQISQRTPNSGQHPTFLRQRFVALDQSLATRLPHYAAQPARTLLRTALSSHQ